MLEYKPWGASVPHAIGDTTITYMYDVYSYNYYCGRQRVVASYQTLELALDKSIGLSNRGDIPISNGEYYALHISMYRLIHDDHFMDSFSYRPDSWHLFFHQSLIKHSHRMGGIPPYPP